MDGRFHRLVIDRQQVTWAGTATLRTVFRQAWTFPLEIAERTAGMDPCALAQSPDIGLRVSRTCAHFRARAQRKQGTFEPGEARHMMRVERTTDLLFVHCQTACQFRVADVLIAHGSQDTEFEGGRDRSGYPILILAPSRWHRDVDAADRAVPGHWEGDLVFGSHNSQIATLVERQTRYVMLVEVAGKDTTMVVDALIKNARRLPKELYRSLTWDRGKEMAAHRQFTLATDIQVYFCDPHKPWQRGSSENTNGLLRQYLPKGLDLSGISQAKLNIIAKQLNERPRKTLAYETPAERYRQCVASIS